MQLRACGNQSRRRGRMLCFESSSGYHPTLETTLEKRQILADLRLFRHQRRNGRLLSAATSKRNGVTVLALKFPLVDFFALRHSSPLDLKFRRKYQAHVFSTLDSKRVFSRRARKLLKFNWTLSRSCGNTMEKHDLLYSLACPALPKRGRTFQKEPLPSRPFEPRYHLFQRGSGKTPELRRYVVICSRITSGRLESARLV